MDNTKQKRTIWRDRETIEMLGIIKDSHILKLLDSKMKRNKTIYEDVQKELSAKGIYKSALQIRSKFKSLKVDYYKAKRNNNTSGAERLSCPIFEILDEVLNTRPSVAAKGLDTSELSAEDSFENELKCLKFLEEDSINDLNSYAEISNTSSTSGTSQKTEKHSYQKVIEQFTAEWKQTQQDLIKELEKQEEKHRGNMNQMLQKNRDEMRKLMEEDRRETATMISSLLSSMKTPPQQPMASWYSIF